MARSRPGRAGTIARMADTHDAETIFKATASRFAGRMDIKMSNSGPDDAPLLRASGKSFAMLCDGELVVSLHPVRCAQLVEAGKGRLYVRDGHTHEQWLVIDGLDPTEWKAHTMEALAHIKD